MAAAGLRRQVVAWIGKAEWEQVLEYLYSRDCELQRYALNRISAWKSRYGNSMPLAVDCTADLVRCKSLDMSGGVGAEELVLLYGLTLVRFINLITERKQKTVAIPLRRLAVELNIPDWIVTLRHEITHGKLPKLSMCRKGWDCVMEWLRREYWSRQLGNSLAAQWASEEEEEAESDTEDVLPPLSYKAQKREALVVKLRDTLRCYTSEQFKIFQELQQAPKGKKQWNATAELEWIIAQVKDLIRQNSLEAAAETILEDGFIIPTEKQLRSLNIEQEEETLNVPRALFRVWQPLLKVLHSPAFTQELLEKMFAGLGPCQEPNREVRTHYLSCWIADVLSANHRAERTCLAPSQNPASVKNKWKLFAHRVLLQWKRLMQKCLECPCRTTPHLLKLIFTYMRPRLATDTQEKLLAVCSIYTQGESSDVSQDCDERPIYTVESLEWKMRQESKVRAHSRWERMAQDLPEEEEEEELYLSEHTEDDEMITEESCEEEYYQMMNMKLATERRAALQGSVWGVSTEFVKWGEYPLGVAPGQTEDPGCLLLDSYSVMSVLDQQGTEARRNGHSVPISPSAVVPSENLLWNPSELHCLKAGLLLF